VRVTPKSVQDSLTTPQTTSGQSSRQSFVDALASASSASAQGIDATHSEERRGSDKRSKESTDNQDQNSNSFSIQSKKNQETSDKAHQGDGALQSTQHLDSKSNQSADTASSEKASQGTSVGKSGESPSKKAAFTVQVATQFVLQASTARPELNGVFPVPAPAIGNDALAAKSDSPEQPADAQTSNVISDQGTELQGQPDVTGPINLAGAKNLRGDQESDAEGASAALKAARVGTGRIELELNCTDQASDLKILGKVETQLPTAAAGGCANDLPAFDPTGMLQASLAADTQKDSITGAADVNLNQVAVKAIQSKSAGSGSRLNSDAGGATQAEKSGDARGDRSSLTSADTSSLEALSTQPCNPHVVAADTKGSDAGALQTIAVAAQVESRGATGTPSTTGSIETTAHRGNGSEGLTSEQLNGSELAGMSGINAAQLIQTMSASEMRMGMHSSEFGDISIRTSVTQQQMQTQISVDHDELGNALSAHIPNMQMKLGSEYGLHATIEVIQSGASFSNDGDRSQQHEHKTTVQPVEVMEGPVALQKDLISVNGLFSTTGNYRLDIRA
jgi:hypothetical protein